MKTAFRAFLRRSLTGLLRGALRDRYCDLVLWDRYLRRLPALKEGRPRVLILNHNFDQDIAALELANSRFELIPLSPYPLRYAAFQIFPPQAEQYRHYNSNSMRGLRRRYRRVLDRFASELAGQCAVRAVLSPSDNFFYVRELVAALNAVGIPFVVVDKEGLVCPSYFEHFAQFLKASCPLIAGELLVWNVRQKSFWERAGTPPEKIRVVGQPRSDFWKQPERWLSKDNLDISGLRALSKMLLFFTYDPWAYTPEYMVERGEMDWTALRRDTHRALYAYASTHPEIDLVIKAHPQQPDLDAIHAEIAALGLSNVILVSGNLLSSQLILSADCIVVFQTTALLESMVTEKPVLYTFWGEARDKWSDALVPYHQTEGVRTVTSPDELISSLNDGLIEGRPLTERERNARKEFLLEYFVDVDGRASTRTLRAVQEVLNIP